MKRLSIVVIAIALSACSVKSVGPVTVPLQYKTMAAPAEFPSLTCAAISGIEVRDAREDKSVIGTRSLQESPSQKANVMSSGDAEAWVRSGLEAALKQSGAKMGQAGAPTLVVTLDSIKTDESAYHRSQYDGRVALTTSLRGGGECWKETGDGFSENYGYAGSAENYQETLNHALDRATIKLLGSPAFKKAACGGCP